VATAKTASTVEANRDSLRPLLAVIGRIPLKDLTVQDVRTALKKDGGHACDPDAAEGS
jgi:hypothetical protein